MSFRSSGPKAPFDDFFSSPYRSPFPKSFDYYMHSPSPGPQRGFMRGRSLPHGAAAAASMLSPPGGMNIFSPANDHLSRGGGVRARGAYSWAPPQRGAPLFSRGVSRGASRGVTRGFSSAVKDPAPEPKEFVCESCNVRCHTEALMLEHMGGKKHNANIVKLANAAKAGNETRSKCFSVAVGAPFLRFMVKEDGCGGSVKGMRGMGFRPRSTSF